MDDSDLIIGADTVYTWKTPAPALNAPRQPQRVVDKEFRGYDLEGGKGNDTIIVYKGDKDQVNWHLIDGGDGKDIIVVKDYGKPGGRDRRQRKSKSRYWDRRTAPRRAALASGRKCREIRR